MSEYVTIAQKPIGRREIYGTRVNLIEDEHIPGAPLVICFAGQGEKNHVPTFDFFEALHWLEADHHVRINKIFVRDVNNNWYHRGIEGVGGDVDQVAAFLRARIEAIAPSKVITLGNSMGGYAAILFAALLGADLTLAFCPRAFLDTRRAVAMNDMYFYPALHLIERECEEKCYYPDLPRLLREKNFKGKLDIFVGSKTGDENAHDAVNVDALHAAAFHGVAECTVHVYPNCGHDVARYMKQQNIFDRQLEQAVLGRKEAAEPSYEGHLDCVSENLLQGWVWDKNNPDRKLSIEIMEGDKVLFVGKAHAMRTDHEKARREDGLVGFYEWLPEYLSDGKEHLLSVRVKGSEFVLPGSPVTFKYGG